ncbi:hypothetical protein CsSME_00011690 [Camellia sinensis var. sinensis]
MNPSATDGLPVGTLCSRSAKSSCKICLTAAEDRALHGNAIQTMYAPTISLIMFMTQRDMVLGSRTINRAFQCVMAQETKLCMLISNAMQTNKQRPNSHH